MKRRRILPCRHRQTSIAALVILFDIEKIEPVAIMPDGVIQKVRVAAMSAVGARYLAPAKPRVLGLFGSGWQASAHLEFLAAQYGFDRDQSLQPQSGALPRILPEDDRKAGPRSSRRGDSPKEAVEGSDFIQAATAAWDPVFDGHWVEKGMYVASIGGSDASNKRREIDDECIRRADVYFVHSKEVAQNWINRPTFGKSRRRASSTGTRSAKCRILVAGKVAGPHTSGSDHVLQQQYRRGNAVRGGGRGGGQASAATGIGQGTATEWFLESVSP